MEANKEEAVRCRDLGANALRGGQNARAVKMFAKSLHLYPLPGVEALLGQVERRVRAEEEGGTASTNNGNGTRTGTGNGTGNGASHSNSGGRSSSSSASADAAARPASSTPTWAQLAQFLPILVILALSFLNRPGGGRLAKVKDGSRYFSLTPVKPHTNPQATRLAKVKDIPYFVSDQFLRTVGRDRYQLSQVERMVEKSYEKYLVDECKSQRAYKRKLEAQSTRSKGTDAERADLARRAGGFEPTRCAELEDLFLNMPGEDGGAGVTGGSRYFSLTPVKPHTNPQATRLAKVKDIPYYVSDQFLRTVARDRYQLSQVERMVEKSYKKYLLDECKSQRAYKRRLEAQSTRSKGTDAERADLARRAGGFEPTRCAELEDLFPRGGAKKDGAARHGEF